MPRKNKKRSARVKNLIVVCTLSAVILTVSTYAWFIGMRTVNVSSFDVEIASTESLMLSLDGKKWAQTVSINKENLDVVSYTGHTNSWGGSGLVPMSSIGEMDDTVSRMVLYEKASLTATPGGYRLMASRVNNFDANPEQSGYVVFDLFVRNYSGTQYIVEEKLADEEAIYLTTDSEVGVATTGVSNTGIENSVRVAFAQIGRVIGTENDADKITGITCTDSEENGVTGLCRTAQIWEPNDQDHVANAISWYNKSCKGRKAPVEPALFNDVTDKSSFDGTCGTVADENTYPTYAVSQSISSEDNIDIYDGEKYNGYLASNKLVSYPYFTDSMKKEIGTARPEFMRLAPNSITKIRIYVYIEGQDVDNYDFAAIGKKIAVKFGFTKERFTQEDINYPGNGGPVLDMIAPAVTLNGDQITRISVGETYEDQGATAMDLIDGDLTTSIITEGVDKVTTTAAGTFVITYKVTDKVGNTGYAYRTVIVEE